MSYVIRNGAPRPILRGIDDQSGRQPVYEPEAIPSHLPHIFLFTESGGLEPQLGVGDKIVSHFGRKTFDESSEYATHQTVIANTVMAEGNNCLIQRLVPPGANPPSSVRLAIDIVEDMVPTYERGPDGRHVLSETGEKIPTGDVVPGYNARWLLMPTLEAGDDGRLLEEGDPRLEEGGDQRILNTHIGNANVLTGTLVNADGEQSKIYPIADFQARWFGAFGNLLGFRLSAPTVNSAIEVDVETIEDTKAYMFRMSFLQKSDASSTPVVLTNNFGERFVDFTFKPDSVNRSTEKPLYISEAVIPSYIKGEGLDAIEPPIGDIHVYQENFEFVLGLIHAKEAPHGFVEDGLSNLFKVNPFTAHDWNNIPYESLIIKGPADGGIILTETATHYLRDGYDGLMTFDTFDMLVRHQLENYGDLDIQLLNDAKYPQSVIYDSGFSLETKKAMYVPMGRRKDMYVVVSTQDASRRPNTASEEASLAVALRTAARLYPESVIYGTPTCRAVTIGGCGYLNNSNYRKLLPLTVNFAKKSAAYMGAGSGIWDENEAFDMVPNNIIDMFRDVNTYWLQTNVKENNWSAGLVWPEDYDRRSVFWPAIQTVYSDDSSVLNSFFNMAIAVELQKVAVRVWRDLTGISKLTKGQFIERSNRLIEERTSGRFDGRVVIVPETFQTENDDQRGHSWSCKIHMYGNNMMSVGSFTVVAHRMSDL